jgi:predicted nuclease of predicted toxin-antitoxin system
MRFLVDDQLPPALGRWLTAEGHQARHVFDIGLTGATDRTIWAQALESSSVMITKDADFLNLQRQVPGPAIVWVTIGNCSKPELLRRFAVNLPEIIGALAMGELIVELR